MAEGGGEGNGLTLRGKVEGFNEMLSIQHFDLPEGPRSGELMFLSTNASLREG